MALDGAMLRVIKTELEKSAIGAKVDKVYQPSREELVLALRGRDCNKKLLLSSRASSPRLHFTTDTIENPAAPPMFCMLLRKRLISARLNAIRQSGLERVLFIDFAAHNELGDEITLTLAVEIMGRCSNIVLIDENNRVVDSIKRVDDEMSSQRLVLPGLFYQEVPAQDKLDITKASTESCIKAITVFSELPLSKAVMNALQGVSPLCAREIAFRACGDTDSITGFLSGFELERLHTALDMLRSAILTGGTPCMAIKPDGKPFEFSYIPILQYGAGAEIKEFSSCAELLDSYYSRRDSLERMKTKSATLRRLVANALERAQRKFAAQSTELKKSEDRDLLRQYGDLITANLYRLEKGTSGACLDNYFEEGCPQVKVRLDPQLTPTQNAQKYYRDYRRAQSAQAHLEVLLKQGEEEITYLEAVLDSIDRAESERELAEIRAELETTGYLRKQTGRKDAKKKPAQTMPPLEFTSSDGYTILVGRNNIQNDRLTLKTAAKDDIWLHTLKIPGSHTVICSQGREVPPSTIEQAAILAAYHSKAQQSGLVAVDYTKIRYVSKPNGAKPGMVIYTHQSTVYVHPDEAVVQGLKGEK